MYLKNHYWVSQYISQPQLAPPHIGSSSNLKKLSSFSIEWYSDSHKDWFILSSKDA